MTWSKDSIKFLPKFVANNWSVITSEGYYTVRGPESILVRVNVKYETTKAFDYFGNSPQWRQLNNSSATACSIDYDCIYYLNGDTVLNGKKYFSLFRKGQKRLSPGPGDCVHQTIYINEFYGFVRQEEQKIFFKRMQNEGDELAYDFGLSEGDTIRENGGSLDFFIIDSISFREIGNQKRKVFFSKTNTINDTAPVLIEGMGGRNGFLSKIYEAPDVTYRMGCFLENDSVIWVNTNSNALPCNLDVSVHEIAKISEIKSFPNPAKNKLFIQNLDNIQSFENISLSSIQGKIVYPKYEFDGNQLSIGVETLPSGVYFLHLRTNNANLYSKFIKE